MQQGTCLAAGKPQNGAVSGVVRIHAGNEKELLEAVAAVGPVAATVDTTSNAYRVRNSVVLLTYYTVCTNSSSHSLIKNALLVGVHLLVLSKHQKCITLSRASKFTLHGLF